MPAADLEEPIEPSPLRSFFAVFVYQAASQVMYSMPVADSVES